MSAVNVCMRARVYVYMHTCVHALTIGSCAPPRAMLWECIPLELPPPWPKHTLSSSSSSSSINTKFARCRHSALQGPSNAGLSCRLSVRSVWKGPERLCMFRERPSYKPDVGRVLDSYLRPHGALVCVAGRRRRRGSPCSALHDAAAMRGGSNMMQPAFHSPTIP
jgi:hypothetical protein